MEGTPDPVVERGSGDREDASSLYRLVVLAMMMFDGREEDEILRLAMTAACSVRPHRVEAGYLLRDGELVPCMVNGAAPSPGVDDQVRALRGKDGPVSLPDGRRAWGLALRGLRGHSGYLVVGSDPGGEASFLLRALAQQTGAALANAALHRREREQARALAAMNQEWAAVNARLAATVAELERQRTIHDVLTEVSVSGQAEEGIARALHELMGLPVVVEDRFGNLRAWAGPGRPESYAKPDEAHRADVLRRAERHRRPIRDRDRLIALAQRRGEVLGVLGLVDPDGVIGAHEVYALEYGATVLALELAHLRSLAEVELRLRRDLVEDLITGTDSDSAYARSAAVGHDLHGMHYVTVVQWRGRALDDASAQSMARAAAGLGMRVLVARRSGMVVLLVAESPKADALYRAAATEFGSPAGAIGVGGRVESPAEFPRSFQEALRALEVRQQSRTPDGVTAFHDLGIYRVLGAGEGSQEVDRFVREWLGPLLDYDARRHSDLVHTLSEYFESGGNYDDAAAALVIHRSTLRYRLQRIREITGLDLADVDNRLNLHVATRAWKVRAGSS